MWHPASRTAKRHVCGYNLGTQVVKSGLKARMLLQLRIRSVPGELLLGHDLTKELFTPETPLKGALHTRNAFKMPLKEGLVVVRVSFPPAVGCSTADVRNRSLVAVL